MRTAGYFCARDHVCRGIRFNSKIALCIIWVVCKQKLMYLQFFSHFMKYSEPCLIEHGSAQRSKKVLQVHPVNDREVGIRIQSSS